MRAMLDTGGTRMHLTGKMAGALALISLVVLIGCPKREWDNPFDIRSENYVPPPVVTSLVLELVEPDTLWATFEFGGPLRRDSSIEEVWLFEQEPIDQFTIEVPEGYGSYGNYIRIHEGPGVYGIELYYAEAFLGRDTINIGGWVSSQVSLADR
jgi:hypothetical protein